MLNAFCCCPTPATSVSHSPFALAQKMQSIRLLVTVALVLATIAAASKSNPLDDYVNLPDNSFSFTNTGVVRQGSGWTAYIYNMTSQTWLNASFSDHSVWWHFLAVVVPANVPAANISSAFLYITSGSSASAVPSATDRHLGLAASVAVAAGLPAAVLYQVPNQPIVYPGDPFPNFPRSEDASIAYTWSKYLTDPSPNPFWVLQLPMTKAAVRAMDAVQQIIPTLVPDASIGKFFVSGASKRGWVAWLTAAVDKRVAGVVPLVLSALDVAAFFHRQQEFYGGWTFLLSDYYKMNIMALVDSPAFATMTSFIDPIRLRKRLTMPKLFIAAVGDEFQMPDDTRYWSNEMPGEMNQLVLKNADHTLATAIGNVTTAMATFVQALRLNVTRPKYSWRICEQTGAITVKTQKHWLPHTVTVYYADSPSNVSAGRRDFRWAAVNATPCTPYLGACLRTVPWLSADATQDGKIFTATMPLPAAGLWRGFLLELRWNNTGGVSDFVFTSPVSVIPNTTPFPECTGAACQLLPLC